MTDDETRTTSTTGGEKGTKPQALDLVPPMPLLKLAEHYAKGAEKYASHNWRRGYEWSKAYAAMMRHALAFWGGEDLDPETGTPHMAAVAFHAFTLLQFAVDYPEFDDRYKAADKAGEPALNIDEWVGEIAKAKFRAAGLLPEPREFTGLTLADGKPYRDGDVYNWRSGERSTFNNGEWGTPA
jgi:hypothetical protein